MDTDEILQSIDELAQKWRTERTERLARRHLDRDDFAALARTGYLRLIVPETHGGSWTSVAESGPPIVDAVRTLATGDPSVALVASMHPGLVVFWTATEEAPPAHQDAWSAQRAEVFQSAIDGHFWGTISSEPGTGGDLMKTGTRAEPSAGDPDRYHLNGQKHFGSGSEVVSFMVTTAKVPGQDHPNGFVLDLRDQPWDGTGGLVITKRWDGMGMKATQSHAVLLDGIEGTPLAWPGALAISAPFAAAIGLPTFTAVVVAVVDEVMAEAAIRLSGRTLRAYDDVEWVTAEVEHWMIAQAMDGLQATLRSGEVGAVVAAGVRAKIGVADMAERLVGRVCRAIGGGAFSASSPFASWYEDVRALGYLRPPWALAYDQLIDRRPPGYGIEGGEEGDR